MLPNMASQRPKGNGIELRAYAGVDPATGRPEQLTELVPADLGKREFDRRVRALDRRAGELAESRRARRKDPTGARPKIPARPKTKTVGDAVEAWWKHHGSKLAGAPKTRSLIDGIILPHLGGLQVTLMAGTPPDDEEDRDADLVYLKEKWPEIQRIARKPRKDGKPVEPLEASTIHRCHGIVGAALRRAGHPIPDPGLPTITEGADTTPLPEEMVAFLPHLAGAGTSGGYTATRRVRGSDQTVTYTVPARATEPSAMDLMLEAFALLVASGPRPVEAAAITRPQVDLTTGVLSLDARGVILTEDDDGIERWVIALGETAKRRRRVITLDARVCAALKRWLAWQRDYALRSGSRLSARSLVFSLAPDADEPLSPKVLSKAFERAVARARVAGCELPVGFHLYDMRHFGITQMLRSGTGRNVAAVAKRFGTSTRMIEERYEHAIQSDDAALAGHLGAIWGAGDSDGGVVLPGTFGGHD